MTTLEERLKDFISSIKHERVRDITAKVFDRFAPNNIIEAPSSSSGKYHPKDECGKGGWLLHAERVAKICDGLSEAFGLMPYEQDILKAASLLHDLTQFTDNPDDDIKTMKLSTKTEHANTIASMIESMPLINREYLLVKAVKLHSGKWGADESADEWHKILAKIDREDLLAILFHIADYIASRRYITIEREEQNAL